MYKLTTQDKLFSVSETNKIKSEKKTRSQIYKNNWL